MCGITGFIDPSLKNKSSELEETAFRMAGFLAHRGPDDVGVWGAEKQGLSLGHRRLSVIDLSRLGHQPMMSSCGRYAIVLNGEIYNFKILRVELEKAGSRFFGHSDTEVFLEAISRWGLESALSRSVGMFAFALWNKNESSLTLGRDRLGEKPLYYGWNNKIFFFGSELKSFSGHRQWSPAINQEALALYLKYNYVPAPSSIYQGIAKLLPGHFLVLTKQDQETCALPKSRAYWTLKNARSAPKLLLDKDRIVEELERLLCRTISQQMISDVPIGAFLSGGIDSSVVVALMQKLSSRPVKTFSIGFEESSYNEADQALRVARHLKTDHEELYVSDHQAQQTIPKLALFYDEPFADSSQIPTFLVSQLARQHVTVSLSGDGGDEVFGGYNRYFWGKNLWKQAHGVPHFLRSLGAQMLTSFSPASWDNFFTTAKPLMPGFLRQRTPGDKIHKLARALTSKNADDFYQKLATFWDEPALLLRSPIGPLPDTCEQYGPVDFPDFSERMMYFDTCTYLPDDILVKLDRASMAVSLESRVPYLDHRVVEYAWRIPGKLKIRGHEGKYALRQLLSRYVPQSITDRPKMGFALPLDSWLRKGPLREWAESLLDKRRLEKEGILNPDPFLKKWREHLSGKKNWQHHLWGVLMFESWLDAYKQR